MDQLSPSWYRDESPETALADTKESIAYIQKIDPSQSIVRPVITPRFAPSCSGPLMKDWAISAASTKLPVQTHISENTNEIALVQELFPLLRPGRGITHTPRSTMPLAFSPTAQF